jgi:hypothetical protein
LSEIKSEVMGSTTNRLEFTLARPTWNYSIQSTGLKQRKHLKFMIDWGKYFGISKLVWDCVRICIFKFFLLKNKSK